MEAHIRPPVVVASGGSGHVQGPAAGQRVVVMNDVLRLVLVTFRHLDLSQLDQVDDFAVGLLQTVWSEAAARSGVGERMLTCGCLVNQPGCRRRTRTRSAASRRSSGSSCQALSMSQSSVAPMPWRGPLTQSISELVTGSVS